MTKIADLKTFDVSDYLDSEEKIAEYLAVVLEDNDPTLLAAALGDVARARGMTQLARDTGLAREALYVLFLFLYCVYLKRTTRDISFSLVKRSYTASLTRSKYPFARPQELGLQSGLSRIQIF